MNVTDVKACAEFYETNYLKTFYLIITYYGRSFILVGKKENFPHLMGIQRNTYRSNGYRNPRTLYTDILNGHEINHRIIPPRIAPTSKMYKKALNFQESTNIFWKNKGPITINFNPSLSNTRLNNVDVLMTDTKKGYILGWVANSMIPINGNTNIQKYCISTWIDESLGTTQNKEKYMPGQDIELIRYIYAFDNNSKLLKHKEYIYSSEEKTEVLKICERNQGNLLIDEKNTRYYAELAQKQKIHCKINGLQY